jgi:hypothetical protein
MKKTGIFLAGISAASVAVLAGVCIVTTSSTERAAAAFLADVRQGQVGQPPSAGIVSLPEHYRAAMANHEQRIGQVGTACKRDECDMAFLFDNRWLRRLRLAPSVWMRARVGIHQGVLTYRIIEMGSGGLAFFEASVSDQMQPADGNQPFSVGRLWSGGRWREHITITPAATDQQRKQAFGFNIRCLSKVGGCQDALELLPTVPWGPVPSDPQFSGKQ